MRSAETEQQRGFGEKVAALAPMVRPGLLERSTFKLMKPARLVSAKTPTPGSFGISTVTKTSGPVQDSTVACHEDLLPTTFKGLAKKKTAMIHPEAQQVSEGMTPAKWKQTLKDVPLSIVAGGLGYGIGRTLTELIGEHIAATGNKPAWLKAVPAGVAFLSTATAMTGSHLREGLKRRREEADR